MGTTASGITLNNEKFGMLYGNHIRTLIRRRTELSRFQEITYGLWVRGCYTEARRGKKFYTETVDTKLDGILK
jgi:hypothetical protein